MKCINFHIDQDTLYKLNFIAAHENKPRSFVIREMITKGIESRISIKKQNNSGNKKNVIK